MKSNITSSKLWWNSLPYETKFFKTIIYLKKNGRKLFELSPDKLSDSQINEIFNTRFEEYNPYRKS